MMPATRTFAAGSGSKSIDSQSMSSTLKAVLQGRDVQTVEELSLATPAMLFAIVNGHRPATDGLRDYLERESVVLNTSPFVGLNWRDRIRLHRRGVLSIADFFERLDELNQMIFSGDHRKYHPAWRASRTNSEQPLASWRKVYLTSIPQLGSLLPIAMSKIGIRTVGEVCTLTRDEVLKVPMVGNETLKTLEIFLKANGLGLNASTFLEYSVPVRVGLLRFGIFTGQDLLDQKDALASLVDFNATELKALADVKSSPIQADPVRVAVENKAPVVSSDFLDPDLFSVRVNNVFEFAGIQTWDQLAQMTEKELLRIPNMGRKSLHEIKEELAVKGRSLGESARAAAPTGGWNDVALTNDGLSIRTVNALATAGLRTVGDLIIKSAHQLARLPNLGPGRVLEIKEFLRQRGLTLLGESSVAKPVAPAPEDEMALRGILNMLDQLEARVAAGKQVPSLGTEVNRTLLAKVKQRVDALHACQAGLTE